jgi:hypothetical protein
MTCSMTCPIKINLGAVAPVCVIEQPSKEKGGPEVHYNLISLSDDDYKLLLKLIERNEKFRALNRRRYHEKNPDASSQSNRVKPLTFTYMGKINEFSINRKIGG